MPSFDELKNKLAGDEVVVISGLAIAYNAHIASPDGHYTRKKAMPYELNPEWVEREVKEIKSTIRSTKTSWFVPWLAGAMFTLGMLSGDVVTEGAKWWEAGLVLAIDFCFWPLILGAMAAEIYLR